MPSENMRYASGFYVKNMWLEHIGFRNLVKEWWNSFNIIGKLDFIFCHGIQTIESKAQGMEHDFLWTIGK